MALSMVSSKAIFAARAKTSVRGSASTSSRPVLRNRAHHHIVRASDGVQPETTTTSTPSTNSVDTEAAMPSPVTPPTPVSTTKSLSEVMAFAGPGPELINGRAAMLAFVAAAYAEAYTNKPVMTQLTCEPLLVAFGVALIAAGSFVTMTQGTKVDGPGAFKPNAEMLNGRVAMLGFAALLVVENVTGKAFF
mmetsp:Transcript_42586/g.79830  ORF Transcript_42586/g.79830 Transcript_42586/m.79830 type:complete len:191 (+) Transcript_42586:251-823(+)